MILTSFQRNPVVIISHNAFSVWSVNSNSAGLLIVKYVSNKIRAWPNKSMSMEYQVVGEMLAFFRKVTIDQMLNGNRGLVGFWYNLSIISLTLRWKGCCWNVGVTPHEFAHQTKADCHDLHELQLPNFWHRLYCQYTATMGSMLGVNGSTSRSTQYPHQSLRIDT